MTIFALLPDAALPPLSPPPQAVMERGSAIATATATAIRTENRDIRVPFAEASVVEDLAEEVLGTIGFRIGEEFFGLGVLDDRALGHENDAIGRAPGEAHLVCDDDHRHALTGERRHDGQNLVDHLGIERAGGLV